MTYEESNKLMRDNVNIVRTNGNKKFPYYIDRLLIMPSNRNDENELCIIKWVIGKPNFEFKMAFDTCGIKEDNFDVYVYTKTESEFGLAIKPMLLEEYHS